MAAGIGAKPNHSTHCDDVPKTIKPPDLAAAVVWDSNSLFSENDTELVSAAAANDLAEIRKTPGIEVIIPRVVVGELLFRKDWRLGNLRSDVARKLSSISELVSLRQPDIPDHGILRVQLQRRFVTWCKSHQIRLWRVPFDRVNWRTVASAAINRRPPFSPFEPKGKSEKGFRDTLILETLSDIYRSTSPKPVVFICADELLAESATTRVGSARLTTYKTSSEYLSYLKLQREKFAKETIAAILEEATALFYTPHSVECVYNKFNIPHQLQTLLAREFAKQPLATASLLSLQPESFNPTTNDGYYIGSTNIEDLDVKTNAITFKTEVSSGRAFQSSNTFTPEQLRVIDAIVVWSATWQIAPEIAVTNPRFISAKAVKTSFEVATDERLQSFNLPTLLSRAMASLQAIPVAEDQKPQL